MPYSVYKRALAEYSWRSPVTEKTNISLEANSLQSISCPHYECITELHAHYLDSSSRPIDLSVFGVRRCERLGLESAKTWIANAVSNAVFTYVERCQTDVEFTLSLEYRRDQSVRRNFYCRLQRRCNSFRPSIEKKPPMAWVKYHFKTFFPSIRPVFEFFGVRCYFDAAFRLSVLFQYRLDTVFVSLPYRFDIISSVTSPRVPLTLRRCSLCSSLYHLRLIIALIYHLVGTHKGPKHGNVFQALPLR